VWPREALSLVSDIVGWRTTKKATFSFSLRFGILSFLLIVIDLWYLVVLIQAADMDTFLENTVLGWIMSFGLASCSGTEA
jgi:hypothetical protein